MPAILLCPLPRGALSHVPRLLSVSLQTEAGAPKGEDPQTPQKGVLLHSIPARHQEPPQHPAKERAELLQGERFRYLLANKDTCVFCHFLVKGLRVWWRSRGDSPSSGEMSRVKPPPGSGTRARLAGKSPTSAASGSLLRIFGLSTNDTHKTRVEKLLKEESHAWNPGGFTCKMPQGSPCMRDALSPLSIWLGEVVLHCGAATGHPRHRPGTSPAPARHILLGTNQPWHTHQHTHGSWMTDTHEMSVGQVPP